MNKLLLILFIISLVICFILGCSSKSYTEIAKDRTKLINGFESYQSIEKVKAMFKNDTSSWIVIEDSKSGNDNAPFNIYTVEIKNYSHLGFIGDLRLDFFNNRLEETWFYPVEYDKYVDLLVKKEGIVELKDKKKNEQIDGLPALPSPYGYKDNIQPYIKIWFFTDYRGKKYVGWGDTRLIEEKHQWINEND
jgi:hypothetical protein